MEAEMVMVGYNQLKIEFEIWENYEPNLCISYINHQADPYYSDSEEYAYLTKEDAIKMISMMEKYILAYDQFMGDKNETTNT